MAAKEPKAWVTVNGVHVPIFEGETKSDAVKRAVKKGQENAKANEAQKEKDIKDNKKEAQRAVDGVREKKVSKYHKDKNVSDTLEALGWIGKKKPMFIDKMTHGYRVSAYTEDEKKANKIALIIKKETGIDVTLRKRSGYGSKAGQYDIIIPFADV